MFEVTPSCLRDLGWSRIVRALAERTATDIGRDAATALSFFDERADVDRCLDRVVELMEQLQVGSSLPLSGTVDIRAALTLALRGGVLDREDLLAVSDTARAAAQVKRHLAERGPALVAIGAALPDLGVLAAELGATFDRAGQIRDEASPELAAARRRLVALHRQAKDRLDAWLARPDLADVLQDAYYTQREDRYVVPIIASFQAQVPGIIHGASNTGQTVYIEPSEFIELNNQVKVAENTVAIETLKVLRERTAWVAADAHDLRDALAALIELDVLQARARLGADLGAHRPTFSTDGAVRLDRAFNPHLLLKGSRVVPNDIRLEIDQAFVVITGPNTGGKTVTLSTVGTFALMARAGLPIPASPDSALPLFDSIFALVGDAQDIEQDLSTFSGHLLAIQRILDAAVPGALVLLDEIIVGTEPTQGAALAIAVLESLATRGARGFVTTHYERLKTLAFEDTRFGNASVGIDTRTLAPNFVLTAGEPGSSNPFEIAARLGMAEHLLTRARAIAGGGSDIAEALRRLSEAREGAAEAQRAAERARDVAERRAAELEAERGRLREAAREEVRVLTEGARAAADEALAAIRERTAELQRVNDPREIAKRRQEVLEVVATLPDAGPRPAAPPRPPSRRDRPKGPFDAGPLERDRIEPGLAVWIRPLESPGAVVDVRGDKAMVAIGAFRTTVTLDDLGRLGGASEPAPVVPTTFAVLREEGTAQLIGEDDASVPPPQSSSNSVDLRGMRRDDVEDHVGPLLDRAFRDNLGGIWVIHGHGTGALRDEVRRIVRESPYVAKWRPGLRHEGGDGVTIAWLSGY